MCGISFKQHKKHFLLLRMVKCWEEFAHRDCGALSLEQFKMQLDTAQGKML